MKLNERSRTNLVGVHPDMIRVVEAAAARCEVPIVVTEGLRNLERQKELKAAGKSWTLNSRHLTGHAVDIVDADNYGYDIPDLDKIAAAMKSASADLKVPIVWGGDWKTRDTPHFELSRKAYPASGVPLSTQLAEVATKVAKARTTIATSVAGGAVVVGDVVKEGVPAVPEVVTKSVEHVGAWRGVGKALMGIWGEVAGLPWHFLAVAGVASAVLAFLRLRERNSEQAG